MAILPTAPPQIRLVEVRSEHTATLEEIARDYEIRDRLMTYPPENIDISEATEWIERRRLDPEARFFVVEQSDDSKAVGFAQLSRVHMRGKYCFFGLALHSFGRRRGYGIDTLQALMKIAQGIGLNKMLAEVRSDNIPSLKMCLQGGFACVGTMRSHYLGTDVILLERAI